MANTAGMKGEGWMPTAGLGEPFGLTRGRHGAAQVCGSINASSLEPECWLAEAPPRIRPKRFGRADISEDGGACQWESMLRFKFFAVGLGSGRGRRSAPPFRPRFEGGYRAKPLVKSGPDNTRPGFLL